MSVQACVLKGQSSGVTTSVTSCIEGMFIMTSSSQCKQSNSPLEAAMKATKHRFMKVALSVQLCILAHISYLLQKIQMQMEMCHHCKPAWTQAVRVLYATHTWSLSLSTIRPQIKSLSSNNGRHLEPRLPRQDVFSDERRNRFPRVVSAPFLASIAEFQWWCPQPLFSGLSWLSQRSWP